MVEWGKEFRLVVSAGRRPAAEVAGKGSKHAPGVRRPVEDARASDARMRIRFA